MTVSCHGQRQLWRVIFVLLVVLVFAPSVPAQEQVRIALIVTNQNYSLKELKLTNTHADGKLVKDAVEAVGCTVWEVHDTPNRGELEKAIGDHVARLTNAGPNAIGFFYYSGHGAADGPRGRNYLIPTEANITHAAQLRLYGLAVEQITDALAGAGGKMSFVVFDACRNVPLQRADKSTFKGFAPFREEPGLLIAYATEPGNVAVDENLYARALAEEIVKQGSEAGSAFRAVSRRVYEATGQRQRPEYNDRRFDDFVFKPALPPVAMGTFPERPAERQRELQEAGQQEKQAQDAVKGAGDAKKAAVDISSLAPPLQINLKGLGALSTCRKNVRTGGGSLSLRSKMAWGRPALAPRKPIPTAISPTREKTRRAPFFRT